MKKKFLLVLFFIVSLFALSSCNDTVSKGEGTTYTDLLGREVVIEKDPKRVVCIGSGALRLYSYLGDMSYLVGAEDIELNMTGSGNGKPLRTYKLVYKNLLKDLPSCGNGGSHVEADAEKILACNPDIVISRITDKKLMDNLQNQIKKPVVVISYGDRQAFDEKIKESIELLGKIFHKEERASSIVAYINSIEADLNNLTKNIAEEDKPSVYLGCYTNKGAHGFESSTAQYPLFEVSNVKNILDMKGMSGIQPDVKFEDILDMMPDKVILDAAGLGLLKNQYSDDNNAEIINAIKAFKDDEVYVQLPYNGYYTNLELAYCDAYFIASVCYPDLFKDINVENKYREIIKFFLGVDVYDDVIEDLGLKPGKLDLKATFDKYR